MRRELKEKEGKRDTFKGIFMHFGTKKGWKGRIVKTLMFIQITDLENNLLTDHVWFTTNQQFEGLELTPGTIVQFDARIRPYVKGYRKNELDYGFKNPTKIKILSRIDSDFSEENLTNQNVLERIELQKQAYLEEKLKRIEPDFIKFVEKGVVGYKDIEKKDKNFDFNSFLKQKGVVSD